MTEQEETVLGHLREAIVALDAADGAAVGLTDVEDGLWSNRIKFMRRMVERATAEFRHHLDREEEDSSADPAPSAAGD